MNSNQQIRKQFDQYFIPNYNPMPVVPNTAKGSKVWDLDGKEYLDFASGIAVSVLGHRHPKLVQALTEQSQKLWHSSNFFTNQPATQLAQKLCELTFAENVFFANSGLEANEAALKLAFKYAEQQGQNKPEILAFENAFHGRSWLTTSISSNKHALKIGSDFNVRRADFNSIQSVKKLISDQTCAVIIEPVQGEGGVRPADQAFLQALKELCVQHQALLIFDEVQTGVGRTTKLYAYQYYGVTPDILTSGKALGGGFPLSAVLTTQKIGAALAAGSHGSTFGGNPLACAVGLEVLKEVSAPSFLPSVSERQVVFWQGLQRLQQSTSVFKALRGLGFLVGLEFQPAFAGQAANFMRLALTQGLMLLVAGPNVVRLAPALNISAADLQTGLELLEQTIQLFSENQ